MDDSFREEGLDSFEFRSGSRFRIDTFEPRGTRHGEALNAILNGMKLPIQSFRITGIPYDVRI